MEEKAIDTEAIKARWEGKRWALSAELGTVTLIDLSSHPLAYADAQDAAGVEALVLAMNAPNDVRALIETLERAEQRVLELAQMVNTARNWIREEGARTDVCTFDILGEEICNTCRCERVRL